MSDPLADALAKAHYDLVAPILHEDEYAAMADHLRKAGVWGPLPEVDGLVQMHLATFIEGKGWLMTRRGMMYGGRHGEPPLISADLDFILAVLNLEVKTGLRAMKHRLERPDEAQAAADRDDHPEDRVE